MAEPASKVPVRSETSSSRLPQQWEPFERFRRASACDLVESARDEIAKEISDSFEPGCVSCVRRVVISVVVGRSGQARERINAQELRRRRVLGPRPAPGLL